MTDFETPPSSPNLDTAGDSGGLQLANPPPPPMADLGSSDQSGLGSAHVDFTQCDDLDGGDSSDTQLDLGSEDDNLSGFEFMQKYTYSTITSRRQEVAKNFVDIFAAQIGNRTSEDEVFSVFDILSQDQEVCVKSDLLEQAGRLGELCFTLSDQYPHYISFVEEKILPAICKLLLDDSSQLRKTCRLTLGYLAEKGVVSHDKVRSLIVPLIDNLTDTKQVDDLRAEAVGLMVKFAIICGREMTIELFLDKFVSLCRDEVFSIRKTCALSITDMLHTIGEEATETHLLCEFSNLCADTIWGVRKVCTESFVTFSFYVCENTRREVLTPLFINLLQDSSRWVKMAAFQNLGPFIATFADKAVSGLSLDAEGRIMIHPEILEALRAESEKATAKFEVQYATNVYWCNPIPNNVNLAGELDEQAQTIVQPPQNISSGGDAIPPPSTPAPDDPVTTSGDSQQPLASASSVTRLSKTSTVYTTSSYDSETSSLYERVPDGVSEDLDTDSTVDATALSAIALQSAVPSDLLLQYVSMVDPKIALKVNLEPELAKHCAFAFPGVAYTLGREYWPCLRKTYHTLARDMQWKVRRSLAFSIHELALILGPEVTMNDLLTVFDSFLTDLDEVKAGILKHFAEFLKLLDPPIRESYLHKLNGFIKPDNVRNWRFRQDLAEQLILLCYLYTSEQVRKFIVPLAISLSSDRVAHVRMHSFRLIATIIAKFYKDPSPEHADYLRELLLERFAKCNMFFGRLTYVQLCEVAMPVDLIEDITRFGKEYLPKLLALHKDNVVNIRIALSRTLDMVRTMRPEFFLVSIDSTWSLAEVIDILANDTDRDVRYYCGSKDTGESGGQEDSGSQGLDHTADCTSPLLDHTADSPDQESGSRSGDQDSGSESPPNDHEGAEGADEPSAEDLTAAKLATCTLSEEHSQEGNNSTQLSTQLADDGLTDSSLA